MNHVGSGPIFPYLLPQVYEAVFAFQSFGGIQVWKKKMVDLGGFPSISPYGSNDFTLCIWGNSFLSPKDLGQFVFIVSYIISQKVITFFDLLMLLLLDFAWASLIIVTHAFFFICIHLVYLHTFFTFITFIQYIHLVYLHTYFLLFENYI